MIFSSEEKITIAKEIFGQAGYDIATLVDGLKMDNKTIQTFLSTFPPAERIKMLKALQVPTESQRTVHDPSEESTAPTLALVGTPEYAKLLSAEETAALIMETEAINRELSSAIIEACPARLESEQEYQGREQELRGLLEGVGDIGDSANLPLYVVFKTSKNVLTAVYKPSRREGGLRNGIPVGSFAKRAWLAAQIDRALQLDVVPPTILRDGPEGIGSMQEWKIGKNANLLFNWQAQSKREEIQRIAFLDVVTTHCDRHKGNFLIGSDGKIYAIDTELIFSSKLSSESRYDGLKSRPLEEVSHQEIPENLRNSVDVFRFAPKVRAVLKKAFLVALGDHGEKAWKQFLDKLEQLVPQDKTKKGYFPQPDWS